MTEQAQDDAQRTAKLLIGAIIRRQLDLEQRMNEFAKQLADLRAFLAASQGAPPRQRSGGAPRSLRR